ncbi:hypothetical protein CEB3_c18650 [Peptococcaceae bacterium CEB3]|nr:hypothetical protein CEB3_c18650 [Peptococcaceae bacterium CEB3]
MFLSVLSALLIAFGIYHKLSFNRAEMRRREVLVGTQKVSLKQRVTHLGELIGNKKLKGRLETIGVDPSKYFLETIVFMAVMPVLMLAAFTNIFFGFVGIGLGYLLSYLRYSAIYQSWARDIIADVPDLVTYLKIRLDTGDIPVKAVENIAALLKGGMAAEWERIVAMTQSGVSLETALMSFADRIDNRDLTAVLVRLVSYAKEGVPQVPFGDLSEHMNHLKGMQKRYKLKRATTPMTVYAGISMMVAMIVGMVPYFYHIFVSLMGTLPAGALGH